MSSRSPSVVDDASPVEVEVDAAPAEVEVAASPVEVDASPVELIGV
jgi:hypothetical protein